VIRACVLHCLYYLIQMEYTKIMYYRTKFFFSHHLWSCVLWRMVWRKGVTNRCVIRYTKHGLCADCTVQIYATHRDDNHALLLQVFKKYPWINIQNMIFASYIEKYFQNKLITRMTQADDSVSVKRSRETSIQKM